MILIYTWQYKNRNRNSRHDHTQNNFLWSYRRPCRRAVLVSKSRDYGLKSTRNPESTVSRSLQAQRVASPLNGAAYVRDKLPAWRNPFPVQTIYPEDRHGNVFRWDEKPREGREGEKKEKAKEKVRRVRKVLCEWWVG